jgi:phage terminase large subunit
VDEGKVRVQFPPALAPLFQPARYKILYGGRGAAKSWGVARALLVLGAQRKLRILCAREIQRTIADSVHRLLSDQIPLLGLEEWYRVKEAEIVGANGTEILFAGLRQQSVHQIKSFEGADIVWVEEAQVVTNRSWDILIPTIRKEGSEIWVTFNPDLDTDATYKRFVLRPPAEAKLIRLTWRDNPWFPGVLEGERRRLEVDDPEAYRHVWEGEPLSAVPGAIYAKEITKAIEDRRICRVPYDPGLKTHAIWDLGWNDQTSIAMVQRHSSEIRVIDYLEDNQRTLAEYVSELTAKRYNWSADWLPHDGQAKEIRTGKSPREILESLGRTVRIVPNVPVENGIKAARMVFPRVYFDEVRAERLVECLRRYRRHVSTKTDEYMQPVHDEYSHGADVFRYLSLVAEDMGNEETPWKPIDWKKYPTGIV